MQILWMRPSLPDLSYPISPNVKFVDATFPVEVRCIAVRPRICPFGSASKAVSKTATSSTDAMPFCDVLTIS